MKDIKLGSSVGPEWTNIRKTGSEIGVTVRKVP